MKFLRTQTIVVVIRETLYAEKNVDGQHEETEKNNARLMCSTLLLTCGSCASVALVRF